MHSYSEKPVSCRKPSLPVRWSRERGRPIALMRDTYPLQVKVGHSRAGVVPHQVVQFVFRGSALYLSMLLGIEIKTGSIPAMSEACPSLAIDASAPTAIIYTACAATWKTLSVYWFTPRLSPALESKRAFAKTRTHERSFTAVVVPSVLNSDILNALRTCSPRTAALAERKAVRPAEMGGTYTTGAVVVHTRGACRAAFRSTCQLQTAPN